MEHRPDKFEPIALSLRDQLLRRGLALEYVTLGWNVIGVVVVGFAASTARSVALTGFALDSLIEIFASVVVVWHLKGASGSHDKLALRLIGISFIALAVYISLQTSYVLMMGGRPAPSLAGIIWLSSTVIAMLFLARGKLITGRRLNNEVLKAESRVTVIDAYLAAAVLGGVVLNALAGWWWTDPLAGLVVVYYAIVEGIAHWREGRIVHPEAD